MMYYPAALRMTRFVLVSVLIAPGAYAQQAFIDILEASPRHQEWVEVEYEGRIVHAFIVYPEVEHKAKSVVVIHENRGLNIWVRTVADRLAAAGYIAIAPDLLSGHGPDGGRTSDFASSDAARDAIYKLVPDAVTADLSAVASYVAALPAANAEVSVAGFCWGGSQSFRFATNFEGLTEAFVFYGRAPTDDSIEQINAPVHGFYGGADTRVNATIHETETSMKTAGKTYDPVVYDKAGHGFMRRGVSDGATDPDAAAADEAWARWLSLLNTSS